MIHDYIWIENLYTKEECKELVEIAKTNRTSGWVDIAAPVGKKVNVIITELKFLEEHTKKFFDAITDYNRRYFEFDVYDKNANSINFNFYSGQSNEYPFHRDANTYTPRLDIKLTAILNCSQEPYEGGDFQIYFGNEERTIDVLHKTGALVMFPSFFYHRVTPVTKGERITMSYWVEGPSWK